MPPGQVGLALVVLARTCIVLRTSGAASVYRRDVSKHAHGSRPSSRWAPDSSGLVTS
ncbi:hypothetical protein [Streptomyces lavendofoliae]|uniref:hypothetical protein n=1 Tax=Streptomyces lavendofoliae TaxID=67314 RepID=UPI003D8B7E29